MWVKGLEGYAKKIVNKNYNFSCILSVYWI